MSKKKDEEKKPQSEEKHFKMVGHFDKDGHLSITRAGKLVRQWCPFNTGETACNHGCPHLDEPVELRKDPTPEKRRPSQFNSRPVQATPEEVATWPIVGYGLSLCYGKQWRFDEFKDERPEPEENE